MVLDHAGDYTTRWDVTKKHSAIAAGSSRTGGFAKAVGRHFCPLRIRAA
jgi:hypothetical protein